MISKETVKGIKKAIRDWSDNDPHMITSLLKLFDRIVQVPGNNSFRLSMVRLVRMMEDLAQEHQQ